MDNRFKFIPILEGNNMSFKNIRLYSLLFVLVFSVACMQKPKEEPTNTEPTNTSIITAEGDTKTFISFPNDIFDAEKVKITLLTQQQADVTDFTKLGSQVKVELPLTKLKTTSLETLQANKKSIDDNRILLVIPSSIQVQNSMTMGFASVIVNGDTRHPIIITYLAKFNTVNILLERLKSHIETHNIKGETITLEVQNYYYPVADGSVSIQQTVSKPSVFSGMYYVQQQEFEKEYNDDVYKLICGETAPNPFTGNTLIDPNQRDVNSDTTYTDQNGSTKTIKGFITAPDNIQLTDGKLPLILLHGWQGSQVDYMNRRSVHTALCNRADFIHGFYEEAANNNSRKLSDIYQIFSFGYDSMLSIEENALLLKNEIQRVFGEKKVVIIGFSMGGVISHTYLQNHANNNVLRFFALSAPMLGSHTLVCADTGDNLCKHVLLVSSPINEGDADSDPSENFWAVPRAVSMSRQFAGTKNLAWQYAGKKADGTIIGWYETISLGVDDFNISAPIHTSEHSEAFKQACEDLKNDGTGSVQQIEGWRILDTRVPYGFLTCEATVSSNANPFLTQLNGDLDNLKYAERYTAVSGWIQSTSLPSGGSNFNDLVVPEYSAKLNKTLPPPNKNDFAIDSIIGLGSGWTHGQLGSAKVISHIETLLVNEWQTWWAGQQALGNAYAELTIIDGANQQPVTGVTISLCGNLVGFQACVPVTEPIVTENNGTYKIRTQPGEIKLKISKSGYITTYMTYTVESNGSANPKALQRIIYVEGTEGQKGGVGGLVINSTNAQPVAGVKIDLRRGINVTRGEIIATTQSNAEGQYSFSDILLGNYTATLTKDEYTTSIETVNVLPSVSTPQNLSITPNVVTVNGKIRTVLTWGTTPSDLDSHLFGPITNSQNEFHVYFSNQQYSENGSIVANLDVDDTDGEGPETTTLFQLQDNGVYRYYIFDYVNKCDSTAMKSSDARVQIFTEGGNVQTFNMPNRDGGLWHVFNIKGSTIEPVNQVVSGTECSNNLASRTNGSNSETLDFIMPEKP